jgi:FkbM family methyltransferase
MKKVTRALLDRAHHVLGGFEVTARLAVLLRNQAESVIRCHLSDGADPSINGEAWLVNRALPVEGATWIDVGAHRGAWSQLCLKHVRSVQGALLVEPVPRYHEDLRRLVGAARNVRLIEAAAASAPGEASFFEEVGNGEMSSLVRDENTATMRERRVRLTTVDHEAAVAELDHVHLLKTDCEGFDLHVLRGAQGLLSASRVEVVQFEYNLQWASAGSTLADAYTLLRGFGYEIFLLKRDGLWRLDYERYGEFFAYSNFVALSPRLTTTLADGIRGRI